jgi:SsrA-binding protein
MLARLSQGASKKAAAHRVLATNRRATHEYELLEELECGIALTGTEVKSLRQGKCSIEQSYALIRGGELFLIGAHIPEYGHGNRHNHVPDRTRKLLAHARELRAWDKRVREKGVTIVPLSMYFSGSLVKVKVALARGRKVHDKRERTKEREHGREMARAMSRRR